MDNKCGQMNWHKHGIIYSPDQSQPWLFSHAALPLSYKLNEQNFRVYFSSRNSLNKSHVSFTEIDLSNLNKLTPSSPILVLKPGPLGFFDDHGVYASSLVEYKDDIYLYYIGWNPGASSPLFYSSIGLAISHDRGSTFQKYQNHPILARSEHDPCLVTSPCVILDHNIWRMWYISGFKWENIGGELRSYYHIKYAESKDGIIWKREGHICLDLLPEERNIARPCVIKDGNIYKMWFSSSKGLGYRIGYAESNDGLIWHRINNPANLLELSIKGWDSLEQAYPWVFRGNDKEYLVYNGNKNGRDGFGLASRPR